MTGIIPIDDIFSKEKVMISIFDFEVIQGAGT
jgi:hypothetical protein